MRDEYRDDESESGMQAQAKQGSPADRVQSVQADEMFHHNECLTALIKEIRLLVRAICFLVLMFGVLTVYVVSQV